MKFEFQSSAIFSFVEGFKKTKLRKYEIKFKAKASIILTNL